MSADPRNLADRLDREADMTDSAGQRHRPHADDLRAAAVLLRHHADLLAAIGDPDGLRELDLEMSDGRVNTSDEIHETVRDFLRRIADAVDGST